MSDNILNWYKKLPKSMIPTYHNPSYNDHKLTLPFRCCIVGGSGSGKTQLILEILHRCKNTFQLIILCVKTADEPLYNFLRSKVKPEMLHIYEDGVVPPLGEYKKLQDTQILFIADDLVNDPKAQQPLQEWWLRGRKLSGGVSMCYLTQSYFKTPKFIRVNCNYIMLKKLSSMRDLNLILSDYNLGLDKKQLLNMYKYAVENNGTFFIDADAKPEDRFRRNFLEILDVNDF